MARKSTKGRYAVLPGDPTIDYPFVLPYGFQPEHGVLVPDKDTADVVRQIFTRAKDHETPAEIAEALNAQKIEPPEGDEWTADVVEGILRNPAYAGHWSGFGRVEPIVEQTLYESAQSAAAG